ncbi:MAG TPA: hypothetical protein VLE96_02840 [Chlamydiales bacterium]|nr:hypothetical protein [Chlamydiales bacterium]
MTVSRILGGIGGVLGVPREWIYSGGIAAGFTRLQIAATQGWMDDVRKFVAEGDDINSINRKNHTALDDAINGGHTAIRDYLISVGAKRARELQ